MSKFRILSIFLAVGLLVGALGVGPVLAGQIDVTGIDTRDASYAPAQLDVDAGEVGWTMPDGEDVKYANDEQMAVFYINDDDLETTSAEQIATWTGTSLAPLTVVEGFNVLTGAGGDGDAVQGFTLTGPKESGDDVVNDIVDPDPENADDEFDSSGGANKDDLDGDGNSDGVSFARFNNNGFATTTFVMIGDDGVIATTTDNGDAVPVGGADADTPIHTVTSMMATTTGQNVSLTAQALPSPDNDLVKVLGGTVIFTDVEIKFTHHNVDKHPRRARVISTSDPQGEYVPISEVNAVGGTLPDADSDIYLGSVQLSKDPGTQGPGADENAVWVQDGDTLTVQYLDDDSDIVDTDTITVDAAKPVISGLSPADGTHTSTENPTLQFDATDTGSGYNAVTPIGHFDIYVGSKLFPKGDANEGKLITVGEESATETKRADHPQDGKRINDDGDDFRLSPVPIAGGYRIIFTTPEKWLSSGAFGADADSGQLYVTLIARDIAGNEAIKTISITIDINSPTAMTAETGTGWDGNKEEETDAADGVKLVMSEAIDPDSVDGSDFEIDGQAAAEAVVGTDDFKAIVYLTAAGDFDADARPDIEIVGEVTDRSGNEVDITKDSANVDNAADKLDPTPTVSRDNALLAAKDDAVTVTIRSDEKLASTNGAIVSIFGPDHTTAANLAKDEATADEPKVHSLEHSIGAETRTGKYGIAVKITDLGGNYGTNLVKVSNEEADIKDVEGDHTITVANGPIANMNFDTALDGNDVMVEVLDKDGVTVSPVASTTVTKVDASARTIVIAAVTGGVKAKVTYHHTSADNTFEVDQDGPGVEFSVVDEDEITNNSPFIRVSFDDDEYPGDSYTDVSMTAATLTMGEDETDISADFASAANGYEYLWAGVNLALGEYTLAVSGEDTAGNSTDDSVTFTVIARPATQVALTPGVNLISLPGTPATTSVEGVFGGSDVTAVLTYDPSTPTKWLAAEKAPDGSWVGNLTEVSASLGYWVTTSSFDALSVDIVSFSAGGATLPPTHNLVPGWNLVAVTTLEEVENTADADPVDANTYLGNNWLRAITYDAQLGRFVSLGPDDEETPELTVGKGYFVWMTKSHTVVP